MSQHFDNTSFLVVASLDVFYKNFILNYKKLRLNNYKKLLESDSQGETSRGDALAPLWKRIWQLNIPEKIRIFAWRLCLNAIPTMVNLNKRGIQVDVLCPICKNEEEDVEHAILNCELAKAVWSKWRGCPGNFLGRKCDMSDMALTIISHGTQRDLEKFFGVAWAIWYHRNQLIFEASKTTADQVWGTAIRMVEDFQNANKNVATGKEKQTSVWRPPPEDFFLINVDGAIPAVDGHSGVGIVIWDMESRIVAAVSIPLAGKYAVEETEALAMEKGVILAAELGLEKVILEGDSLQTVQAVNNRDYRGMTGHIIAGIIHVLSNFRVAEVRHINRNENRIAHELAQQAKRDGELKNWTGTTSDIVANLLGVDSFS